MRLPRARPAAPTAVPDFGDCELNSARPAAPEPPAPNQRINAVVYERSIAKDLLLFGVWLAVVDVQRLPVAAPLVLSSCWRQRACRAPPKKRWEGARNEPLSARDVAALRSASMGAHRDEVGFLAAIAIV
jgi:hypothetical protein